MDYPEILMHVLPALLTALLGGSGIGACTALLTTWLRERSKVRLAESQQPIDQYSELIGHLTQRVTSVENAHRECQEHHIKCEREVGELRGRVNELSRFVQPQPNPTQILIQGHDTLDVERDPSSSSQE